MYKNNINELEGTHLIVQCVVLYPGLAAIRQPQGHVAQLRGVAPMQAGLVYSLVNQSYFSRV